MLKFCKWSKYAILLESLKLQLKYVKNGLIYVFVRDTILYVHRHNRTLKIEIIKNSKRCVSKDILVFIKGLNLK